VACLVTFCLCLMPSRGTSEDLLVRLGSGPSFSAPTAEGTEIRPSLIVPVSVGKFWLWDPASRNLSRWVVASSAEAPKNSGPPTKVLFLPSKYTRELAWDLSKSIPGSPDRVWAIASVGPNAAWLVEKSARQAWYVSDGNADKPLGIAEEEIQGTAALPSGDLVLNCPRAETPFVVVRRGLGIVSRFGAPRPAPARGMVRVMNAWNLATLPSGDLAAVAVYDRSLRVYAPTGVVKSESLLRSPLALQLEKIRQEKMSTLQIDPSCECVKGQLPLFATSVLAHPQGIIVNLGESRLFEVLDASGRVLKTFRLDVPAQRARSERRNRGAVFLNDNRLLLAEERTIQEFGPASDKTGTVLDEDGQAVAGASVSFALLGRSIQLSSDEAGGFVIPMLSAEASGTVLAKAPNMEEWRETGALSQLLSIPIVLRRNAELCVSVVEKETGKAITRFRMEIGKRSATAHSVLIRSGQRSDFANAEGRACLKTPFPPPWSVRLTARGRALTEIEVEDTSPLLAQMPPEGLARLTVLDAATSRAVEGATVLLEGADLPERSFSAYGDEQSFSSNAEGVVEMRGLEEGTYRVGITAAGFLAERMLIDLRPDGPSTTVRISRGATLIVRAVSAASDRPIAGARVQLSHPRMGAVQASCSTGDTGECSIPNVPPARVDMTVAARGFASRKTQVTIAREERETSLAVSLEPGRSLQGRVVGLHEYPSSSFRVELEGPALGRVVRPVRADGGFEFDGEVAGSVLLDAVEQRSGIAFGSKLATEEDQYVELNLPVPLVVSGRTLRDGLFCSDCSVRVSSPVLRGGRAMLIADVPEPGRFEVRLPEAAEYSFTIDERRSGRSALRRFLVSESQSRDLDLQTSAQLAGRVLRADGEPARRAFVTCADDSSSYVTTAADERGQFSCGDLPEGRYVVQAADGQATGSASVVIGSGNAAETVEIRLTNRGLLQMQLSDEAGAPVLFSATIRVRSASGVHYFPGKHADAAGLLEIPVADGPLEVMLNVNRGFAAATWRGQPSNGPVRIVLRRASPVTFVATSGGSCQLAVFDPEGPVPLGVDLDTAPRRFSHGSFTTLLLGPGSYSADYRCPESAEVRRRTFAVAFREPISVELAVPQ